MKKRFILVLGVILLLFVTVAAVAQPFSSTPKSANLSWPARPVLAPAADRSYDAVEQVRVSNVYKLSSYDKVEQIRSGRGISADHSYDKIEAIRLQH